MKRKVAVIADDITIRRRMCEVLKEQGIIGLPLSSIDGLEPFLNRGVDFSGVIAIFDGALERLICRIKKISFLPISCPLLIFSKKDCSAARKLKATFSPSQALLCITTLSETQALWAANTLVPIRVTNLLGFNHPKYSLNFPKGALHFENHKIKMQRNELLIVDYLLFRFNEIVSKNEIEIYVWNDKEISPRAVDCYVSKIRKSLATQMDDVLELEAVRPSSYRMSWKK